MENYSKKVSDVFRAVDALVDRRRHILTHLKRCLSNEGAFWLNSVFVSAKEVSEFMKLEGQLDSDYKQRLTNFLYLGIALGKILELANINNTVSQISLHRPLFN